LLCVKKSIEFASAEPPQLLAPTVDSDKTEALERRPWCWDEAAPCGLGVAAPQAMQSAIAAGHHGVPFSLKKVKNCKASCNRRLFEWRERNYDFF
jgi:hypothetical protein